MIVTSFDFRVWIGEEALQRIPQPIQRNFFLDNLSHTERPDLLQVEGQHESFSFLNCSTLHLSCPDRSTPQS
jgi:hypothetical protein